ncbi:MAG TPA: acyltransferase [Terracidiphilus sp.]|nr:acyltransferase [Terracidiphilus sp.]
MVQGNTTAAAFNPSTASKLFVRAPNQFMRHSANLDLLRSVAVSVVLLDHLMLTLLRPSPLNEPALKFAAALGQAGVLAFFVHTSLVLMYSIQRLTRTGGQVTLRFYVRRFFRIYPLSVFCIALALIFHLPPSPREVRMIVPLPVIFSNLLLMQNFFGKGDIIGALWSLPYEVQMYLVLPVLYVLAAKRQVGRLGGVFILSCLCSSLYHLKLVAHIGNAEYVPCFLCGVLCFSLRDHIRARVSPVFWLPFICLLISGYCIAGGSMGDGNFWVGWVFCLVLGLAVNFFHDSSQTHVNFAAQKIALYSYGMYLIHLPVLFLVFIVFGMKNWILGSLVFVLVTTLASATTYHFIESPFIELGRRLSSHGSIRAAAATPLQPYSDGDKTVIP